MKTIPVLNVNKKILEKNAVNGFLQNSVTIPIVQEDNTTYECIVQKGDIVKEGQLVAVPKASSNQYGAKLHSSVPGVVEDIVDIPCPNGKIESAIKIKVSGEFSYLGKNHKLDDYNLFSPEHIFQKILDSGIINTFEPNFPHSLAFDLAMKKNEKEKLLVVRLYDNDPHCITSELITHWFLSDVLQGSLILAKALDASGIVFATGNTIDVSEFEQGKMPLCVVQTDNSKYPFGFKNNIIADVKKTTQAKPFSDISASSLFTDACTVLEVFNAISTGIPSIEKYVYVDGEDLTVSGLIKTKIGTPLSYLAKQCGKVKDNVETIVVNGTMLGSATNYFAAPVTKYVKSITLLSKGEFNHKKIKSCIRCGQCRYICPVKICPDMIYRLVNSNVRLSDEYVKSSVLCYDCAMCNAICPSQLPLNQSVKFMRAQMTINQKNVKLTD
ncbi:MAG: hypothetical protein IKI31_04405 [Treponema sp.]|nr:hypothetical protein [Treponema sp.]